MFRTLTAVAALAAISMLTLAPAQAQTAAPAKKAAAKKPAAKPAAEPVSATNDSLNPGQLTMADRVLTGVADCEFKQKVDVEKIDGHNGNFKVTFDHKSYIMIPEETTTGAIRLVDTSGAVVWLQIPMKSMLMNQKEHHRLVDNCQEDEQRIAVQSSQKAGANAGALAPSVASPGSIAAAGGTAAQQERSGRGHRQRHGRRNGTAGIDRHHDGDDHGDDQGHADRADEEQRGHAVDGGLRGCGSKTRLTRVEETPRGCEAGRRFAFGGVAAPEGPDPERSGSGPFSPALNRRRDRQRHGAAENAPDPSESRTPRGCEAGRRFFRRAG